MNSETRRMWEKLKPLSSRMEEMVFKRGVKTGSRLFGGATASSDLDVLLLSEPPFTFHELIMEGMGVYQSERYRGEYFDAIYVKSATRPYPVNLILFLDKQKLQTYIEASFIMKKWRKEDPILREYMKDKQQRLDMFDFVKEYVNQKQH